MKIKTSLLTLLAGAVLLQACLNNDEVDPGQRNAENDAQIRQYITDKGLNGEWTESGLYYSTIGTVNSNNRKPVTGDQVYVSYKGSRLPDDVEFDRSKTGKPLIFALNNERLIAGFNEGISLLYKGDSAILLLPSRLAYGNAALQNIPAYSNLRFDVKLLEVRTQDNVLRFFATDSLKLKVDFSKLPTGSDAEKDTVWTKIIDDDAQNTDTTITYYIRTKKGEGDIIGNSPGKQVKVRYSGRFIDGTNFASAGSTEQLTFKEDANRRGYLETIKTMKRGERGIILIPSNHAYRENGSPLDRQGLQLIPGHTPLIYDVEITEVQ